MTEAEKYLNSIPFAEKRIEELERWQGVTLKRSIMGEIGHNRTIELMVCTKKLTLWWKQHLKQLYATRQQLKSRSN